MGTGAVVVAVKHMDLSLADFKRLFWTGGQFYRDFVSFSLGDEEIEVTPWEPARDGGPYQADFQPAILNVQFTAT